MSDVERFAAALKVTDAKKAAEEVVRQAERDAEAARKVELQRLADEAAAHEVALKRARADKQRAVDRLKDARWAGRGVPEAEAAWRDATAAVVELETGERATWDRRPLPEPENTSELSGDTELEESPSSDNGSDFDGDSPVAEAPELDSAES
jgi:hypothetical protein